MILNRLSMSSLVLTLALAGCSGFDLLKKPEPMDKLKQAASLYKDQERPVLAEILIFKVMKWAQDREDPHMLGGAHLEYAELLRSPSITGTWNSHYRQQGFKDPSVSYDTRLDKSNAYFAKAIGFYAKAAAQDIQNQQWGALTQVYFNTAYAHSQLGQSLKACSLYDMTLAAHTDQVRHNPQALVQGDVEMDVPEAVAAQKQKIGCL